MPNFYSWTISTLFLSWLLYPFLHKLVSKLHACGPKLVLFSALVAWFAEMALPFTCSINGFEWAVCNPGADKYMLFYFWAPVRRACLSMTRCQASRQRAPSPFYRHGASR